jgi:hypothetical protein
MQRAEDQLLEEATYPQLAAFLRSGGTLEVGEDFSLGAFARIRKGNKIIIVDTRYKDFAAILREMNSKAKDYWNESGQPQTPETI